MLDEAWSHRYNSASVDSDPPEVTDGNEARTLQMAGGRRPVRDRVLDLGAGERGRSVLSAGHQALWMEPGAILCARRACRDRGGISGPLVAWLIDRAGVRVVMIAGAITVVVYNLALSRANSLIEFAAIFIVAGVAIAASTIIPCSIVITN